METINKIKRRLNDLEAQINQETGFMIFLSAKEYLQMVKEEEALEKLGGYSGVIDDLIGRKDEFWRQSLVFTFLFERMSEELDSGRRLFYSFLAGAALAAVGEMSRGDAWNMMEGWRRTGELPKVIDAKRGELLERVLWDREDDGFAPEEEDVDMPWGREELMGRSEPDLRQILLDMYVLNSGSKEELVEKILYYQGEESKVASSPNTLGGGLSGSGNA